MKVDELDVAGAFLLTPESRTDERGSFTRLFDSEIVASVGLAAHVEQASVAHSTKAGTLRGLHLQLAPSEETKLVRCVRGSLFDVVADTRSASPTYGRAVSVTVDAARGQVVCVPPGVAHGYYTLENETTVVYLMSARHDPAAERGIRWDDPTFAISWPGPVVAMSAKDAALPLLSEGWQGGTTP